MPTVQAMELPKPKNWQDFETMVRDAMSQRWKSPNLQKNGRPGQKQNGVDIYESDDIGRRVGVQCKRSKGSPTLDTVRAEIAAAETFEGLLSTIYIATTADYDSVLQKDKRALRLHLGKKPAYVPRLIAEQVVKDLRLRKWALVKGPPNPAHSTFGPPTDRK
jgi:hypothetical protein